MLFALLALAALPDLVPARWTSADPATLDLVRMTPINCLLVEQPQWSETLNAAASKQGITVLAILHPSPDSVPAVRQALASGVAGGVLEGTFDAASRQSIEALFEAAKLPVISLTPRAAIDFASTAKILGTTQGVWPGIQTEEDGKAKAAPSGAAWIDTNSGFLRFARASTSATFWIANQPPPGKTFQTERYLQAIGDAAMVGARWVVSLDQDFTAKLLAHDPAAVAGWRRIGQTLAFYESHPDWRTAQPFGHLALVEDADSGALLSGGILDMIATKHTPVRAIPKQRLSSSSLGPSQLAVNVDPESLTPAQKDVLKAFTRAGGTLLTGPPGWKFPQPQAGQITLDKDDLKKLDDIWRELNSLTGRKNLGARLFNVSSMLSHLVEIPSHAEVVVHLVNYSDFPVENITVHVLGKYTGAVLYQPDATPIPLTGYEVDEGTGFDIDKIVSAGALILHH